MKALKVLVFLSLVTSVNTGFSQCQPVCVVGGVTVTPSGTQSVTIVGTPTVHVNNTTFTIVPSGTQSVSVVGTPTVNVNNTTFTIVPSGTQSVSVVGTPTVYVSNSSSSGTAVDSIALGVEIGDNNSLLAKQITLNQILAAVRSQFTGVSYFVDTISGNSLSVANLCYQTKSALYSTTGGYSIANLMYNTGAGQGWLQSVWAQLSDANNVSFFRRNGGLISNMSWAVENNYHSVFLDGVDRSIFKSSADSSLFKTSPSQGGKSYFDNTSLSDTLISNTTSMASLVTAVNTFYSQHPSRRILDVQYTNASIAAVLNFFAIIRYKD